ncbi:hypothetical protein VDGL01_09051 [Verticillium dahliae]
MPNLQGLRPLLPTTIGIGPGIMLATTVFPPAFRIPPTASGRRSTWMWSGVCPRGHHHQERCHHLQHNHHCHGARSHGHAQRQTARRIRP